MYKTGTERVLGKSCFYGVKITIKAAKRRYHAVKGQKSITIHEEVYERIQAYFHQNFQNLREHRIKSIASLTEVTLSTFMGAFLPR
jgi:hypothetical protein